jgi:hypothetical protein
MCNICYATKNNINMIDASVETMCDKHYTDWCAEKALGEDWYC